MVPYRNNFHKVYDLTERVLPENINTTLPDEDEYARFLITSFLRAHGLGLPVEMTYLLKNVKKHVTKVLKDMESSGELIQIDVAGTTYYMLPDSMKLLEKRLLRNKLKILSPFDNLLIQRKRMQNLFGFDYLLECYLPAAKRVYGYFSQPILWDGKLVARMDCKADRKTSILHINHLALEPTLTKLDAFCYALQKELKLFMEFNNCTSFLLHRSTPSILVLSYEGRVDNYLPLSRLVVKKGSNNGRYKDSIIGLRGEADPAGWC